MTLLLNLSLFVIFLLALIFFLKNNFKLVYIYGLLVYQGLAIIPSLIYIEEGIYISEQYRSSFFVGATFVYVIYFIITFITIFLSFQFFNKYKAYTPSFYHKKKKVDHLILYYLVIFVLVILLINASLSKLPFFDPTLARFKYWENSRFPFLNKIFGNTSVFIPFALGILFRQNKLKSILLLALYFFYMFLIGQKFSPVLTGIFSFLFPIVLTYRKKIRFKNYINKKSIIITIILTSIIYSVIYKRYEKRAPFAVVKIYNPNEAILYRVFGLQGHLVWGSVESYIYNNESHSYNIQDFLYGMHKLMYKYNNSAGLDKSLESGFSFTNGYPSILFYVFPFGLAFVFHVVLTIFLLAFPGWLLFQFILNKSYVLSVILYQFFNWTIYAFTMGYLYKLKYITLFLICYGTFVAIRYKARKNISE